MPQEKNEAGEIEGQVAPVRDSDEFVILNIR